MKQQALDTAVPQVATPAPRISVVIPGYNCAESIAETLASVFAQSYTDYEVILVNDGSTDTAAFEQAIKPWRDRIRYVRTVNRGVAAARNNGIRASRGEFIALLDSDDLWEPNYLQVQVGKLDADPTADIVYPNAVTFGDGLPPVELLQSEGDVTFTSLIQGTCVVFTSVLARRKAFERVGLLDERLRRSEDFDLWLRCVKSGSRIIYHNDVLVRYRRNRQGSLSSNTPDMHKHVLRVFAKMLHAPSLSSQERESLDKAIQLEYFRMFFSEGKEAFKSGNIDLAIDRLERAHACSPNRRLAAILAVLRNIPCTVVQAAYDFQLRAKLGASRVSYQMSTRLTNRGPLPA